MPGPLYGYPLVEVEMADVVLLHWDDVRVGDVIAGHNFQGSKETFLWPSEDYMRVTAKPKLGAFQIAAANTGNQVAPYWPGIATEVCRFLVVRETQYANKESADRLRAYLTALVR